MRYALASLALALLLGCGDGFLPANDVRGTWAANYSFPGSSLDLQLNQVAQQITGTGSYAFEAGRAGTLELSGTYNRPGITLVLHYDYGLNLTYHGVVEDAGHMSGTLADSLGRGGPLTFTRR
jgi:hypothetical protein